MRRRRDDEVGQLCGPEMQMRNEGCQKGIVRWRSGCGRLARLHCGKFTACGTGEDKAEGSVEEAG